MGTHAVGFTRFQVRLVEKGALFPMFRLIWKRELIVERLFMEARTSVKNEWKQLSSLDL